MAKKATLTYEKSWYIPINIRNQVSAGNEAQIRKEYTRLRDIAQKRFKRLKAGGYGDTQIYLQNVRKFKELKDIKSTNELAQRLSDIARFVSAKGSTVSGQKSIMKKSLKTLHSHGYDFVNEGNYKKFGKFMEEYRDQLLDMTYDSGDAVEVFRVIEKKQVPIEQVKADFELWLDNAYRAERVAELSQTLSRFNLGISDVSKNIDYYLDNLWALKRVRADNKTIKNLGVIDKRLKSIIKRNT